jgi:hypothetical protein
MWATRSRTTASTSIDVDPVLIGLPRVTSTGCQQDFAVVSRRLGEADLGHQGQGDVAVEGGGLGSSNGVVPQPGLLRPRRGGLVEQ